ncbi:hypothetical protein QO010_000812 [Caulobacter ginsengisoli]|uniref:CENP-V/GFA domain-containing protein n=1 Tax=Caulobacter ginsengisoli TaxID=400775 RepID=A0ABU0IPX5_9CAUL|nr:aldehyde-activating protein [Caulobacter ginsengisoli]MDQ0463064.1 hypothetical protein [Caulobacter ginsengisoli]
MLAGACHCGSIRVAFTPSVEPDDLPLRACQCGFCRRHGALTTSDPRGRLAIDAAPGSTHRYRFGRRATQMLVCRDCGVYVAALIEGPNGLLATLNVAGTDLADFAGRTGEPATYDDETDESRLARRLARWTPTTVVEVSPNA